MEYQVQPSSLTTQLYTSSESVVKAATKHPFLEQAGKGVLPASTLCEWLVQDKYYQLAYMNFIGSLLAKLPLKSCAFLNSKHESLLWTTLDMLTSALISIREEIKFYDRTVYKYKLPIKEAPPNETASQYINLFKEAGDKDAPLIHGLVVLWATEKV
jgi:thiaminase